MKKIAILAVSLLTLTNMLHASDNTLPSAEILKAKLEKYGLNAQLSAAIAAKCAGQPKDEMLILDKVQEETHNSIAEWREKEIPAFKNRPNKDMRDYQPFLDKQQKFLKMVSSQNDITKVILED